MDTLYDDESTNYARLKDLTPQDRIKTLYTQTPHSLSRLCLQCIELGCETAMEPKAIVADMVYAIEFFGEKARLGNKVAINTLGRFAYHIIGNGRLRYSYILKFNADKEYFDNEITNAYEKAIGMLHERPQYIKYIKDIIEESAQEIVSVLDNKSISQENEQY